MSKRDVILGVDSSTSATKVVAFDLRGQVLAIGRSPHSIHRPRPGWSEQEPIWWDAFCAACRQLHEEDSHLLGAVHAVGITHQRHSFVPVDEEIRPLRRAILWNDVRCREQVQWLATTIGRRKLYSSTGIPPGPWSLAKILWLKQHEPELLGRTHKLLLVHDFLIHRLTGSLATTESSASAMGCLDIRARNRWHEEILDLCGLPRRLFVDRILPATSLIGRVSSAAAGLCGLPPGTPVYAAAGDQVCGCLGAGVIEAGLVGINAGTSLTLQMPARRLPLDPACHYILEISPTGMYAPETVVFSGVTDLMNWIRQIGWSEGQDEEVWPHIYRAAAGAGPGAGGLCALPFFQGVQAPYWNEEARGVIIGLSTTSSRGDLARALLEGLALEAGRQLSLMERGSGERVRCLHVYGGAARSALWPQLLADVTGYEVCCAEQAETTSLGAAICAAVGHGVFSDLHAAVESVGGRFTRFEPDRSRNEWYRKWDEQVYRPLYERVADLFSQAARLMRKLEQQGEGGPDDGPQTLDGNN